MTKTCTCRRLTWMCILLSVVACSDRKATWSGRLDPSEGFSDPQVVALASAAQNGDVAEIDRLVSAGVDVNAVGREGITPLYWSFLAQNKQGFKRLLEHGATPNMQTKNGDSVMSFVARFPKDSEWLELALQHGGDPNFVLSRNPFAPNRTPIFSAINKHHTKGVDLLITAGADLRYKNHEGQTPLEFAVHYHHFDIVYKLLMAGADYRVEDFRGVDIATMILEESPLNPGESKLWRDKVVEFLKEDMAKDSPIAAEGEQRSETTEPNGKPTGSEGLH